MTATQQHLLRGRRGMLIALGVAACIVLLVIGLPLVAAFNAQANDINDSLDQLAAYQTEQTERPALEARLAALRQVAQSVPGLLSGSSAALAQAQLQSQMKDLIERNGGALLSAQLLPPTHVAGFDVVSISYDLTLPLSRARSLLYAVETHTPFFFIDNADLVMPPNWRPDTQIADPTMEVHATIHAYRWSGRR